MTKSDKIRALLTRNPKLTVAEVADKLGVSKVTVYAVRSKMKPEMEELKPAPQRLKPRLKLRFTLSSKQSEPTR